MHLIRPLEPTDAEYEYLSALLGVVQPDVPRRSGESLRWFWSHMTQRGPSSRWVIPGENRLLGFARIGDAWWNDKAESATAFIAVHPELQRQGYGRQFLERCVHFYDGLDRRKLTIEAMENDESAHSFLAAHGFSQTGRFLMSAFDTHNSIPSFALESLTRVSGKGIDIVDGVEFQSRFPADWRERWWQLEGQAREDMPGPEPSRPVSFENFCHIFTMPDLDLSTFHFAIDGNRLAAMTGFQVFRLDPEHAHIWMTAVARSHRRRGLATAIKAQSLATAKQRGVRWVRTDNEETNYTWQINQAFGFAPQPAKTLHAASFESLRARFGRPSQLSR